MNRLQTTPLLVGVVVVLCSTTLALASAEDFEALPAGTIVAGQAPDGSTASGTFFPGFTLSVINKGNGPDTLVLFDSCNPTGDDTDLGTPNEDFGGPGRGWGGRTGKPGENRYPLGNILVCAENIIDNNRDGLVDDPDDEAGGCVIIFDFHEVVDLKSITFLDIDRETVNFSTAEFGIEMGGGEGSSMGDNSVQTVDLTPYYSVDRLEVQFSSSGSIAAIEFEPAAVSNEDTSWGDIKRIYR